MGFGNILKLVTGIILTLFGLFMMLGFYADEKLSWDTEPLFFILLVMVPTLGGVWMSYSGLKDRSKLNTERAEKEILKLAGKMGGVLSVAQVTTYTSLSSVEADRMLNRMQEKGLAEIKISERGVLFYEFAGMHAPKQFID